MQFIAEDPVHVVCRVAAPALYDTESRLIKPEGRRLYAKFTRGVAPDFARQIGVATFGFKRMPEEGVSPEQWLAFYDSVEAQHQFGYNDEERKTIEAKLLATDGIIVVERPRLPAPWPNFDSIVASKGALSSKDVVEKIVATVVEAGYDPATVIAYEKERDRPRKSVITALEALLPEDAPAPASSDGWLDEELIEA